MPTIQKNAPKRPWMSQRKPFEGKKIDNSKFYQSALWRRLRADYIAKNPLCVMCKAKGLIVEARVVDHIVPINQGGAPLDPSNLQPLCVKCHNIKSVKVDRKNAMNGNNGD